MNREHLIPINVIDIAQKLEKAKEPERTNLLQRIEEIRNYCDKIIKKNEIKNVSFGRKKRG